MDGVFGLVLHLVGDDISARADGGVNVRRLVGRGIYRSLDGGIAAEQVRGGPVGILLLLLLLLLFLDALVLRLRVESGGLVFLCLLLLLLSPLGRGLLGLGLVLLGIGLCQFLLVLQLALEGLGRVVVLGSLGGLDLLLRRGVVVPVGGIVALCVGVFLVSLPGAAVVVDVAVTSVAPVADA